MISDQQDQRMDKMTYKSTKWPIVESCTATKKGSSWLSITYIQGHYLMEKELFLLVGDDDSDDGDDGILLSAGPTDRRNNQQPH